MIPGQAVIDRTPVEQRTWGSLAELLPVYVERTDHKVNKVSLVQFNLHSVSRIANETKHVVRNGEFSTYLNLRIC